MCGRLLPVNWLLAALAFPCFATQQATQPLQAVLQVSPTQCVVLYQGEVCRQQVQLRWQLPMAEDVCLWLQQEVQPRQCWQQQDTASFSLQLELTGHIELRLQQQGKVLATTMLRYAWVHDTGSKKRASWRMF